MASESGLDFDRDWSQRPQDEPVSSPGRPSWRAFNLVVAAAVTLIVIVALDTSVGLRDLWPLLRLAVPILLLVWLASLLGRAVSRSWWSPSEERRDVSLAARLATAGAADTASSGVWVKVSPAHPWIATPNEDAGDSGYLLARAGWLQFYGERARFALRRDQVAAVDLRPALHLKWLDPHTGRREHVYLEPQARSGSEAPELRTEELRALLDEWRTATGEVCPPPRAVQAADGRVPLPPVVGGLPFPQNVLAVGGSGWALLALPGGYFLSLEGLATSVGWIWFGAAAVLTVAADRLRPRAALWGRLAPPGAAPTPRAPSRGRKREQSSPVR